MKDKNFIPLQNKNKDIDIKYYNIWKKEITYK